tara:strand:+ start:411 stop:596 length:186 start_codon:yes stop_codon:yes gene_type:complete
MSNSNWFFIQQGRDMQKSKDIVDSVKDIDDAKETIGNLLEIIDDMKQPSSDYQSTNVGFIR